MNIAINKDIEKYQESVVLGLTAKQLIFSAISVVLGAGLVLLTYRYVGLTVSVYIAIPVIAPIAMNGFYSYQGMSFTQMFVRKMKCLFANRTLLYESEDSQKLIELNRLEKEKQDNLDKRKAINKKYRTKEKTLLLLSFLGGAFGGYPAMLIFRHKTKAEHWYFTAVNLLGLAIHITLMILLIFVFKF